MTKLKSNEKSEFEKFELLQNSQKNEMDFQ
jgi:hypothetical protein